MTNVANTQIRGGAKCCLFVGVALMVAASTGAIASAAMIPGAAAILPGDQFVGADGPTLTGRSAAVEAAACGDNSGMPTFGSAADRLVFGAGSLRCGGFVTRPAGPAMTFTP